MASKPFPYRIEVAYSGEDECFVARVPSIRGCAADGETAEEAVREVQVAAEGMIASLIEHGHRVPEPDFALGVAGV